MYKNIVFAFVLMMGLTMTSSAQVGSGKQVSWASSAKKMGDKMFEVRITATIAGNYHMYAQVAGVEGPLPTTFSFIPNPLLTLSGKVLEQGKKITKREDAWDGNVNYYEKTATFIQIVRVNTKAKTNLNGKVEFMVCNDNKCLPPTKQSFDIKLP
jgi:thiol:disulfide interchange protein DsbD